MSGRSAYVRKKITETKTDNARSRARSVASSEQDDTGTIPDFPMPSGPVGTGVGTTNARFLKFSEPVPHGPDPSLSMRNRSTPSIRSGGSGGSGSDPRRDGYPSSSASKPLEDFAYARARKPTIKTEDVSGIEKSGLRNILDKRSEGVRRGLAKTFTFNKKKDKEEGRRSSVDRPQSAATVRQHGYAQEAPEQYGYDDYASSPSIQIPQHQHHQQQSYPGSPQDMWDGSGMAPPPTGKLPPIPPGSAMPTIKRWIGAGRPVTRWNKLRKDPELWDPNGDVLIFLGQKGQTPRPPPSFRLSSHIIEAAESRYLITLLREGSNEEDIHMPPSPAGAPPMLHDMRNGSHMHLGHGLGRGGQPTPPISEDASLGEADGQISYEMYFPTPPTLGKVDQLRHQITTRNVFALLYHSSLVGLSLYQALSDLHARLDSYMPPEGDNVGQILNYLTARGIDDVRNDPETAMSLLAWSEGSEVRWEEGWRESFMHCAGMYPDLERCADFKHTTPITRALLERACLETQLRVQSAEERLGDFVFGEMWPTSGPVAHGPAKASADRLQRMLVAHYTRIYGRWPPLKLSQQMAQTSNAPELATDNSEEMWLTRSVAGTLQRDFGALYDYLVNRDIVWDVSEARSTRKWMMVSESGNRAFEADVAELPMTDMLIEYDNKLLFPHIPHPYPLIPESIPPNASASPSKESGSMFKNSSSKKAEAQQQKSGNGGRAGPMERRVHLAYTESTNIYVLGSDFTQSDLIDAYVKFEKTDRLGEVDPAMARRGRWVLIYCILQTLASVSVDAPNVRYREGVPYHLSPRLKGTRVPPWKGASTSYSMDEAGHELSHCWIAPWSWSGNGPSSGGDSSADSDSTSPVAGGGRTGSSGRRRTAPSTTGRSSVAGYHTPGTRSVRSTASSLPAFSAAPSVVSESDAGSSIRTPSNSYRPYGAPARMRSRDQLRGAGSVRGCNTVGGPPPIDEMHLPIRQSDHQGWARSYDEGAAMGSPSSHSGGGYARSASSSASPPIPLPMLPNIGGAGSGTFLALDDMTGAPPMAKEKEKRAGKGRGGYERPLLGGSEYDDERETVIRDFDKEP